MASPLESLTGSFWKGVRRNSCAFSTHVYAAPLSLTTVPICGLAITFAHGTGVTCPGSRLTMYSWPSSVNPPRPLWNTLSRLGKGSTTSIARAREGSKAPGSRSEGARR